MYVGLHRPGWLDVLGMPPRCGLRLRTPRVLATDFGQGLRLRRGVRAGSLRTPEPSTREKTRGRKSKKMLMCEKNTCIHGYIISGPGGDILTVWHADVLTPAARALEQAAVQALPWCRRSKRARWRKKQTRRSTSRP